MTVFMIVVTVIKKSAIILCVTSLWSRHRACHYWLWTLIPTQLIGKDIRIFVAVCKEWLGVVVFLRHLPTNISIWLSTILYLLNWNQLKTSQIKLQSQFQIKLHDDSFFFLTMGFILAFITILIASSKMFFRPFWVSALHSIYLHWNSSSMILRAVYFMIGASLGSFLTAAY